MPQTKIAQPFMAGLSFNKIKKVPSGTKEIQSHIPIVHGTRNFVPFCKIYASFAPFRGSYSKWWRPSSSSFPVSVVFSINNQQSTINYLAVVAN
jgi:hypothetical protein